jgi:hypothetical protein
MILKNYLKRVMPSLSSVVFVLVWFAIAPRVRAVIPAPDGGYPGGNTAEGQAALFSLTTGGYNTGIGFLSLRGNTMGSFNTAVGAGTLLANTGDQNTATGARNVVAGIIDAGSRKACIAAGITDPGYRHANKCRYPKCNRKRRELNANGRGCPIRSD